MKSSVPALAFLYLIALACWLCYPRAEADIIKNRDGATINRGTSKTILVYRNDANGFELTFDGSNSDWIDAARASLLFSRDGSTSFTLQAEGPDGNAYDLTDFNSGAAKTVLQGDCALLGSATYPIERFRLVNTAGVTTGIFIMGAD